MEAVVYVPVLLGLMAAFFFASSSMFVRAGISDTSTIVALFLSLSVNVVVLWAVVFVLYDVSFDLWRWRYFVVAGALAPVLGRFFNYTGIAKLGINVSAPITYANPLVSVILAIAFLDERLSTLGFTGAAFVILGGSVISSTKGDGKRSIEKRHFVFPVLAALFYGSSQVFRKLGIDLVPSPLIAAAVTITTSWSLLSLYLALRRSDHHLHVDRREFTLFALAGLCTSVAIPTLYLALQTGTVVTVTPVMNTSPFFVLLFSFLFFREAEIFSPRIGFGTVLIVAGVVLLTTFGTMT